MLLGGLQDVGNVPHALDRLVKAVAPFVMFFAPSNFKVFTDLDDTSAEPDNRWRELTIVDLFT